MYFELFNALNQKFKGQKTYITALIAVLSAIIAYFSGEATLLAAIQLAATGILAASVRSGIKADLEAKK